MLTPSGIYSDQGSGELRTLFLQESKWSHLYVFQNERFVFEAVDHRFKIAFIHLTKSGVPGELATRFRVGPGDSPEIHELENDIANDTSYLPVSLEQIERYSPTSGAILETRSLDDLNILAKLYSRGQLLGGAEPDGWNIQHQQGEFNISTKAKLFPARWKWEAEGYRSDEYGHWLKGGWAPYSGPKSVADREEGLILSADGTAGIPIQDIEDVALPLYQGGMINQLDFSASVYQKFEGRRGFKWTRLSWETKFIEPQYLMSRRDFLKSETSVEGIKLVFRNIARATDTRTFIGALINDLPTCNSIGLLRSVDSLLLGSILNSFTMDWVLRQRLAGTNLSLFVIQDLAVPPVREMKKVRALAAQLLLCHPRFAQSWTGDLRRDCSWYACWALTDAERLRCRAILEACLAHFFHLESTEFRQILSGCDHPAAKLQSSDTTRTLDPRGFWRYQRDKNPEHRLAVLAQVAFEDLCQSGFEQFLAQNDGAGWMLPETLRLADYGLGHDERANSHQPVATVLGSRFYDWQLEKPTAISWLECELHANVLSKLFPPSRKEHPKVSETSDPVVDLFGNSLETDLFGDAIYSRSRKR